MKDERIEQAKNKIGSEIAIIVFIGVIISFLIKSLVFKMDLMEYLTEYVILIFFPIYQFIRMHMLKISIYSKSGNRQLFINIIVTIVIMAVFSGWIIYDSAKESKVFEWHSILSVVIYIILFFLIFLAANKYNKQRGSKYENKYDDSKKD